MKTIIKYLNEKNSQALWSKIVHIAILLVCFVVVATLTTLVVWSGVRTLFADIPICGIIGYIALYIGYVFVAMCVYKSIKEEVENEDCT